MSKLLPLFPLQLVALPGNPVPLHIFEERYRLMVGEAEASGTEFGIVLAKDDGIVNCGCTVLVERVVNRYPDGRFDVLTRGVRRFLIDSVDREMPYLRGEVTFFDDDDLADVPVELSRHVMSYFDQLPEGRDSDRLSFRVASLVDDPDFKSALLRSRSESERLRMLVRFLDAWLPRRAYEARMKRAAPTNGHGHKPGGI